MLRSAYVLPPLPVGVGSAQGVGGAPEMAPPPMQPPVKTTRPDPNVIQSTIVTADGRVPNPAYTADVAMQGYRAALLNDNYHSPQERQQIMSSIENAYAQPGATGQQVKAAYQNASAAAIQARHREQEAKNAAYYAQQPPAPLSNLPPDIVAKPIDPYLRELITPVPSPPPIPTYYDPAPPLPPLPPPPQMDYDTFQPPVMPPTMAPPPLQNLGEVLQRIQQKQPQEMPPVDPGFVIGPREPTGPIPTYYDPAPPMLAPPAQPSAGMDLSRLPTPVDPGFVMDIPTFRPPLPTPEPYTPPSMQFGVDMPRMDYVRDLYGVNPDNVSMLKRGGLAVKPKKGKC